MIADRVRMSYISGDFEFEAGTTAYFADNTSINGKGTTLKSVKLNYGGTINIAYRVDSSTFGTTADLLHNGEIIQAISAATGEYIVLITVEAGDVISIFSNTGGFGVGRTITTFEVRLTNEPPEDAFN